MERARIRLLILAAICGVLMALLSFASWVHFSTIGYGETPGEAINPVSIDLNGYETARSRDREELRGGDIAEEEGWCSCRVGFGDGFITAALGGFVLVTAAGALATRQDRPFAIGMIGASVGSLLLSGFNALGEWQAIVWTRASQTEFVNGSVEPALWALVVVSTIGALLGAALWTLARAEEEDEWDDAEEFDNQGLEEMNSLVLNHEGAGQGADRWA